MAAMDTRSEMQKAPEPVPTEESNAVIEAFPGDTTARTPLSRPEAEVTNQRYHNDPFWVGPKGIIYGVLPGSQPAQLGHLYPDGGSTYFFAQFKLPEGSHLEIHGQFPHTRYVSFTVATQLGA